MKQQVNTKTDYTKLALQILKVTRRDITRPTIETFQLEVCLPNESIAFPGCPDRFACRCFDTVNNSPTPAFWACVARRERLRASLQTFLDSEYFNELSVIAGIQDLERFKDDLEQRLKKSALLTRNEQKEILQKAS